MNPPINIVREFFRNLSYNLPILLICLAAVVIVLAKRRQLSRAFLWSLAGFGLAAFVYLLNPLVWAYFSLWVNSNPYHHLQGYYRMCLWILSSILMAASYALLLIAVCASRSQTSELMPQAGKE